MLELKAYNMLQIKLFKEFDIIDTVMVSDIVEFRKICSLVSVIRDCDDVASAETIARDVIKKELSVYKN